MYAILCIFAVILVKKYKDIVCFRFSFDTYNSKLQLIENSLSKTISALHKPATESSKPPGETDRERQKNQNE